MKTLTTPVSTGAAASAAGWAEVYDIYLPAPVTAPWGTATVLRVTPYPGGLAFFTPVGAPEPDATRSVAMTYLEWPLKREAVKAPSKGGNDKISIAASNVTGEWATMLAGVEWRDCAVVIRLVPTTSATALTADDCVTLFHGQVDAARVTLTQLTLTCSSDLATFGTILPREQFHAVCRFRWADDMCGALRYAAANWKAKTVGSSSTTTTVISSGLTEDSGSDSGYGTDLVAALADASVTASSALASWPAKYVKAGYTGVDEYWATQQTPSDWGELTQGYWQLPDAQSGLANAALKPWIQFDLGSATAAKLWRVKGVPDGGREVLPRMLVIFSSSSSDFSTGVRHEGYFECPPTATAPHDILLPSAGSARYWRICMRTRWFQGLLPHVFKLVSAYVDGRHYWRSGYIQFGASTATVALRGVRRLVTASYSGKLTVSPALPAAPASGDTFEISRGCDRSWNNCCERRNWEAFGGFPSAFGTELVADAGGISQDAITSSTTWGSTGGGGGSGDRRPIIE